jgi:hypothetical protein
MLPFEHSGVSPEARCLAVAIRHLVGVGRGAQQQPTAPTATESKVALAETHSLPLRMMSHSLS